MKKIAFIPLRARSKGVIGKNKKMLGNKPLFCWILDTLIEVEKFDEIWISTDCGVIKNIISLNYNGINIHQRNKKNASDISPTIDVVIEFLSEKQYDSNDWFVLFQATSPFTSTLDIIELCDMIEKTERESIISCFRSKRFRWSNEGIPLDYQWKNKPRRQDYCGMLLEAGAFYASKIGSISSSCQLISAPSEIIEISELSSLDIDTYLDFDIAETYLKHKANNGLL